jgi:hypothetical protein
MYTPAYKKYVRIFAVIWIAICIILALVYGLFYSPVSPLYPCTLIGCRDTLDLVFSPEPPLQYSILLTAQDGKTRSVTCIPGTTSAADDVSAICRNGTVSIYGFTPPGLTVEVTWSEGHYIASFEPVYETFYPNGRFCPPECRIGRISIELP